MTENNRFLQRIFKEDWQTAHVTSFVDDPTNISQERRGICWGGRHAGIGPLPPGNQYFTISRFKTVGGRAVRRKDQFIALYVVVADDVREKLPIEQVQKLPSPSYKLLTSSNSEQWAWILTTPCTDRVQAENLLDGLVQQGLAPDGKDPGMRGVTRYVRLPDGHNSKSNRLINGIPFKCSLLELNPDLTVTMDDLAAPFGIDLHRGRRDSKKETSDTNHPVLQMVSIKEVTSPGSVDITCPWIHEHTNQADNGTLLYTNKDLSFGFKCHHGHCQGRTGKDIVNWIEVTYPDWSKRVDLWKIHKRLGTDRDFNTISLNETPFKATPATSSLAVDEEPEDTTKETINSLLSTICKTPPGERKEQAYEILRLADKLPEHADKIDIFNLVQEYTRWTRKEFNTILNERRKIWYKPIVNEGIELQTKLTKFKFPHIRELTGTLRPTLENLQHLLNVCKITVEYDQITKQLLVVVPGMDAEQDGYLTSSIEQILSFAAFSDLPTAQIHNQLIKIGYSNSVNPVVNYLSILPEVAPGWIVNLGRCLKVSPETELIRDKIFRMFMISACAAADHARNSPVVKALPKFENVMVLVGAQGVTKTKFFRSILPDKLKEFFKDGQFLDPSDKDSIVKNIRFWVSELGELDSTFRRADIARLKAFLSESVDIFRPPFGRVAEIFKRRTVFVGSVNEEEFLKDYTGNRRYWPISVNAITLPNDSNSIDNAWSEAWTAYIGGEQWWPSDKFEKELDRYRNGFSSSITDDGVEEIIVSMIKMKQGCFQNDVVTPKDIEKILNNAGLFKYILKDTPNVRTIGKIMRQHNLGVARRTTSRRYWIIRDFEKYAAFENRNVDTYYEALA